MHIKEEEEEEEEEEKKLIYDSKNGFVSWLKHSNENYEIESLKALEKWKHLEWLGRDRLKETLWEELGWN